MAKRVTTKDIAELAGEAIDRTQNYLAIRNAWITSDNGIMGGVAIIRGTRIPVHAVVAWMKGGDSLDEIARQNYDLPREAFEAAILFAKAHPLAGRPAATGATDV